MLQQYPCVSETGPGTSWPCDVVIYRYCTAYFVAISLQGGTDLFFDWEELEGYKKSTNIVTNIIFSVFYASGSDEAGKNWTGLHVSLRLQENEVLWQWKEMCKQV